MKRIVHAVLSAAVLTALALPALAQPLFDTPRISPAASISQRVGITDITVDYHRPSVKNRDIWDALVPYGQVWRAGANENTTITFTHPVVIGEAPLDAGTYGLHILPTETTWTFIFSHQARAWGSYSYDEAEDAARVSVTPIDVPHEEYLTWSFDEPTQNDVTLSIAWEMKKASVQIWVDTDEVVAQELRDGLRGPARFSWRGWQQAAGWCLQNGTNLDEATQWIDRSIRMESNFTNLSVKSGLLAKQGKTKEADEILAGAMDAASEAELNAYGYQLIGAGDIDKAIAAFKTNVDKHPDSWNAHDSLAEAYMSKGDAKNAIKFYEKALSMVEDEAQKGRIRAQLSQLQG